MACFAAGLMALGILAGCAGPSTPADTPGVASEGPNTTIDADVIEIIATGEEAMERARQRIPTAVLRQVDFGSDPAIRAFRFTDAAATQTLTINFTVFETDNGQWRAIEEGLTPLIGYAHPGIDIEVLRTGPAAVHQAATDEWPDCELRGLMLNGTGTDLTWRIFCNIEAGVVSGTLDDSTGVFTPSPAPPVRPAPTAVPNRR